MALSTMGASKAGTPPAVLVGVLADRAGHGVTDLAGLSVVGRPGFVPRASARQRHWPTSDSDSSKVTQFTNASRVTRRRLPTRTVRRRPWAISWYSLVRPIPVSSVTSRRSANAFSPLDLLPNSGELV